MQSYHDTDFEPESPLSHSAEQVNRRKAASRKRQNNMMKSSAFIDEVLAGLKPTFGINLAKKLTSMLK